MVKKALLVGINAYPSAPLQGCINDLIDYANTLGAKGFSYLALTDSMATKSRILAELRTLITGSHAGDSIAFCFSGHGSYTTDRSGDETDYRDELLVPIDYQSGYYIYDDEIRAEIARLSSGVTFDVFTDSCFSGTVTRRLPATHDIPVLGIRGMGQAVAPKPSSVRKAVIVPGLKEILWAASKDNQTSSEVLVNGVPRGVFSYYTCKALRTYPSWNRNQVMEYTKSKIRAIGLAQVPQLECQAAEATQLPFT